MKIDLSKYIVGDLIQAFYSARYKMDHPYPGNKIGFRRMLDLIQADNPEALRLWKETTEQYIIMQVTKCPSTNPQS